MCTGLTSIIIPTGVKTIGSVAFAMCTGLTSITIPTGVQTIGNGAFLSWTASQIINVAGHANQESADEAWGWTYDEDTGWEGWRVSCNATIKYWNGSSYQ